MYGKAPEVARLFGIHWVSLSRKVSDKQAMTVDELVRIADYPQIAIRHFVKKVPDDTTAFSA